MGSFIVRQPNGLLARFSTVVDCPTHWNMTEEDYIKMVAKWGEEEARDTIKNSIKPFSWLTDNYVDNNMTQKEFKKVLKEMELPADKVKAQGI